MRVLLDHSRSLQAVARRAALLAPLLSLLFIFPVFAGEPPAVVYDTLVIVDFPSPACSGFWPALQSELQRSAIPHVLTGSVLWITRDEFQKGMEFKRAYQILFHGDCGMGAPSNSQEQPRGPLGWVLMVSDQIQPFVYVDCDRVREMLRRDLRDKATAERRRIFARAILRIVVHEMTHIATQSPLHEARGLQKAQVSSSDLLAHKSD